MSKSLGNQVFPQDVIAQSGADILRLWVASTDYAEDQRIGKEILKTVTDNYRKVRNTIRWMLGTLAHDDGSVVPLAAMPELERLMLHRLHELDGIVRESYREYDFKKIVAQLIQFMAVDLSAFYFDVRKDALYCDPLSSVRRKASLQVVRHLFDCLVTWMAPLMPFTMEESWLDRHPGDDVSVHLQLFPEVPADWRDDALEAKWAKIRRVRRVVTGALEVERAAKRIGSSLEAAPMVHVTDAELMAALAGIDLSEVAITSQIVVTDAPAPEGRSGSTTWTGSRWCRHSPRGPSAPDPGRCCRGGLDPEYPDVTPRDADALREWKAARAAAA